MMSRQPKEIKQKPHPIDAKKNRLLHNMARIKSTILTSMLTTVFVRFPLASSSSFHNFIFSRVFDSVNGLLFPPVRLSPTAHSLSHSGKTSLVPNESFFAVCFVALASDGLPLL